MKCWFVLANLRYYRTIGYRIKASIYRTIGNRTQKNYFGLPYFGHNIERETFGEGQITGGGGGVGSARSTGGQRKGRSNCPLLWGVGGGRVS
jgi:hypothetical protein